ncbi:MAG: HAMP domain-containing histidine kinase [Planctomycetes bacterium]|nr:HAMP domain-containing histidine kinase [Planctomycetota bacterium]
MTNIEHHSELSLTEQELFERLEWFTHVRWGAGVCALVFMAVGWYLFNVRFDWSAAAGVVAALFVYNLVFQLRTRRLSRQEGIQKRWITRLAHAQMICDLLAVAALVHTIGGVENHFIILFLFPMVVASEFFPPRVAYLYATLAAVLINAIGWGEFLFEAVHRPLRVLLNGAGGEAAALVAPGAAHHYVFVLQVCFVMTFAAYVTVFIAASIAGRLRMREEELQAAYRDLRSLEQVKSQFMRKTSHELRAPIGAVQSLLKAAGGQMAPDAPGRDLVERAVRRSEGMLDLIDDLLRYSRLQSTAAAGRFDPVELAELVRSAADLFRAQAEEKGIRLDVRAESAVVAGVRDSLADLVDNLLSNAVRYTPPGGRVAVECGCRDGQAVITVSDTGIGIPAQEQPRIFEEFFRGQAAKQAVQHGTGLGLAIVKRVVDLHGGRIGVDSVPGRGTTFRVVLPACTPAA